MAVDAMDIDSSPVTTVPEPEKERKRKHKTKDKDAASSPTKKKRKHESTASTTAADDKTSKKSKSKKESKSKNDAPTPKSTTKPASTSTPREASDSPYILTTATLYLPLSPISISPTHALASLLAEHLSPLLLTYYPPLQGVILAYSNASISSTPPQSSSVSTDPHDPNPQPLTLARTGGEYGVLYVYLTATFLVFRPQRGHILEGWVNVQSEGFLGAVALNLFSVGIERKRLPANWKWVPPGEEDAEESANDTDRPDDDDDDDDSEPSSTAAFDAEKEHFNRVPLASDSNPLAGEDQALTAEDDDDAIADGYFRSVSGHRVRGTVRFRVVDIDVIPGADKDHGFISIEGTMLSPEEEAKVLEDERKGVMGMAAFTPRPVLSVAKEPDTPAVVEIELETLSKTKPKTKTKEVKPEKEKKEKKAKKSSRENKEK